MVSKGIKTNLVIFLVKGTYFQIIEKNYCQVLSVGYWVPGAV